MNPRMTKIEFSQHTTMIASAQQYTTKCNKYVHCQSLCACLRLASIGKWTQQQVGKEAEDVLLYKTLQNLDVTTGPAFSLFQC